MTQSNDAAPQQPDPATVPEQPAQADPAPPAKPAGKGKLIKVLVGVGIVVAALAVLFFVLKDDPGTAKVGDCIAGTNAEDVTVVDCGSGEAEWKVVGKVDGKTEAEMQTACGEFPDAEQAFWQGEKGGKGFVLCMKSAKGKSAE
ncbi:MAG: LppU/SCO3897 family protein [Micromonosporaceae bacterium]